MTIRSTRRFLAVSLVALIPALALSQDDSSQSLGDVARKLRKDTTSEVRMTDADTKRLFESVDRILAFAAEDSGMPKRANVPRRMVSKADVEKYASSRLEKEELTEHFAKGELSMKKLGFLPRDFNLREFLVKSTAQQIAGYYDEETKSISLLNWVPADHQEPILAHELTHALQDQNYDLRKWMKAPSRATHSSDADTSDDSTLARKAVVEGQAMVVYVDYILAPFHRNLADTPDLIYQMEEPAVKAVADSQMMHNAPMIMREAGTLPYNSGLIFEGELLHKGGKQMAFAGAFARPPQSTHEILQPDAYINSEKLPRLVMPDLKPVLGDQYDLYDSGGMGELDVRALIRQYGQRSFADELAAAWQGGAYVTYVRKEKAAPGASPTTADLALLYISKWKTSQAAERFAHFYSTAVPSRYTTATLQPVAACNAQACPVSTALMQTEEGPVIVEHWNDNTVIVSEGFDLGTATKVSGAARDATPGTRAAAFPQDELALRLYQLPAFRDFAEQIGRRIADEMIQPRLPQE